MKTALVVFVAFAALAWCGDDNSFLIRHATVHPVSGPDIPDGSILVRDGKIVGVGGKLSAPPGVRVIDAKGMHVYPGMINSATELGVSEISSIRETNDTNELGDFNPQLRAEVAINPSSEHIPVTRANGITSAMTLPSTGGGQGIITGQSALIHLKGWTWEEMNVEKQAAMNLQFPSLERPGREFFDGGGGAPAPFREIKRGYEEKLRKLREFIEESRRYQKAKEARVAGLEPDLKFDAMIPVLEKKIPLMVMATREREMKAAIDFAKEQDLRIILAGCRELGKLGPELKAANIPVILGPSLETPEEEDMPYDQSYALAGEFYKAGVKIAFGTFDVQFARNLPYQAAMAAAFGLPKEEALKSVTLNAAEIWGVANRIGSIQEGKWADLIITDGDPLETQTQVLQLFIQGKPVDLDTRHKRLYDEYRKRP
jgi:imidazolonepropionase-like amidohydrolase